MRLWSLLVLILANHIYHNNLNFYILLVFIITFSKIFFHILSFGLDIMIIYDLLYHQHLTYNNTSLLFFHLYIIFQCDRHRDTFHILIHVLKCKVYYTLHMQDLYNQQSNITVQILSIQVQEQVVHALCNNNLFCRLYLCNVENLHHYDLNELN